MFSKSGQLDANIEEAIYLGDRVIVLSANPRRVAGEIDVDIHARDSTGCARDSHVRRVGGAVPD